MNSSSNASEVSFTFLVSIVEVSVACCGVDSSDEDSSTESTPQQATETSTMENKKVKDTSEAFDELFNS